MDYVYPEAQRVEDIMRDLGYPAPNAGMDWNEALGLIADALDDLGWKWKVSNTF